MQKIIVMELTLPTTVETAFVQVKSKTDQAQLDDYIERFTARDDARMFYVYHTSKAPTPALMTASCLSDRIGLPRW